MRFKALVWALWIVLLAESPALAKMHADSPPGIRSFIALLIWILAMTWLFRRSFGTGGLALAFGIGTVAAAVVLGEYVEAFLIFLKRPPVGLASRTVCICAVSVVAQTAAAVWAGRLNSARPVSIAQALRVPTFWVVVFLPAVYDALKPLLGVRPAP